MEDEILAKVLEIEKQINEKVKVEKEKTARWLEREKEAVEREKESEIREMEASLRIDVDKARENAEKRAEAMIVESGELCRLLSESDDKILKRIVEEQLGEILPGMDHDSKDVES